MITRGTGSKVSDSVGVRFVHFEEIFGAQFFLTDVANNSATICGLARVVIQVNIVHLLHVSLHEVFVAQFLIANVAIVCWCTWWKCPLNELELIIVGAVGIVVGVISSG